ncbi:LysR family transcriptional regulator [Shewanella sp. NIFS-20-20]|uniref:LysR family transcriptional regulator n=1 Tax=Shewanella sp. NIFS-20-20 TaxID=2853806 RepID=UPI001C48A723|nr:LysR family transcriptional regulator [Shewanella sp. NIFS-20-20]MBV7314535.1 LysR family transcriptional regulator [Shewanella sp. NIFS-20-20]
MSIIDPKLLDGMVLFTQVVSAGSFTGAAQRSGHSTSYISKEINRLEQRLGLRLLHRTTRTLNLTPDGEAYYLSCQQIIDDAKNTLDMLQGRQQQISGKLTVSCPVNFGLGYLRPLLVAFMARYPKVELVLDLNDRKVDLVAEGVDVAIRGAMQLADSSLISRPLLVSELLTLASPAYLARAGTPSSPTELSRHKCICYRYLKDPQAWQYRSPAGEDLHIRVNPKVMTNSPAMQLALCLDGEGIIRLPAMDLESELASGALVRLFEDYDVAPVRMFLVYPARQHMASRVKCFIDGLLAASSTTD